MQSEHERYQAISRFRKAFWRRYLTVLLVPILALMLAGGNALFMALFGVAFAGTVVYTRYLLYRLALTTGFSQKQAILWTAASLALTGLVVGYAVLEAPLRRAQRGIASRAFTKCPECHANVWEGQTDCYRCGIPVPGVGLPYWDA